MPNSNLCGLKKGKPSWGEKTNDSLRLAKHTETAVVKALFFLTSRLGWSVTVYKDGLFTLFSAPNEIKLKFGQRVDTLFYTRG